MNKHIPMMEQNLAECVALQYKSNVLVLRGNLNGSRGVPRDCDDLCNSMRLISLRAITHCDGIAIFIVPDEDEMAEVLETVDGRPGHHAICLDAHGRLNEHYIL